MGADTSLFDRWSASYDRPAFQAATYRPIHDAMLRRIGGDSPSRVLDLGCGTGQLTRRLTDEYPDADVIGLDYSSGMLANAHDRAPHAHLIHGDAGQLPLADSSIDVVCCSESFHWYPDQRRAAEDVARVLRPGGRFLLASIATVTGLGDDMLRQASSLTGQTIRALPPHRLQRLLSGAGFDVSDQGRLPRFGLVPWPVLTDARLPA